MIKNTLSKTKKNSSGETSDISQQIETTSLLSNLPALVSSDNVPFEKFENSNSSSFETKDENSRTLEKSKKIKKKKWFKKKSLEPLLS